MKDATVSELKNQLSRFLAYVRKGGRVRVLDRDTPVAELGPPAWTGASAEARMRDLEKRGVVRCPARFGERLPASWYTAKRGSRSAHVLEALLEEREKGR